MGSYSVRFATKIGVWLAALPINMPFSAAKARVRLVLERRLLRYVNTLTWRQVMNGRWGDHILVIYLSWFTEEECSDGLLELCQAALIACHRIV